MFIKRRHTKEGITFHLINKDFGGYESRKIPARSLREAREYLRMYEGERVAGRASDPIFGKEVYLSNTRAKGI